MQIKTTLASTFGWYRYGELEIGHLFSRVHGSATSDPRGSGSTPDMIIAWWFVGGREPRMMQMQRN